MKFFYLFLVVFSHSLYAKTLEEMIQHLSKQGQRLLIASIPLFGLVIGYLYKRGKSEAKQRLEDFIIGILLVTGAFSIAAYFK